MNKSVYERHYPLWLVKSCASWVLSHSKCNSSQKASNHLRLLSQRQYLRDRGLTALFRCFRKF